MQVGILMGSDNDWSKINAVGKALDEFGVQYEVNVMSAHRTPGTHNFARHWDSRTDGPCRRSRFIAFDRSNADIAVATVGTGSGGARNAGLLAVQMLALSDPKLQKKLEDYRAGLPAKIAEKNTALQARIKKGE